LITGNFMAEQTAEEIGIVVHPRLGGRRSWDRSLGGGGHDGW
jgi:hypothetical protein